MSPPAIVSHVSLRVEAAGHPAAGAGPEGRRDDVDRTVDMVQGQDRQDRVVRRPAPGTLERGDLAFDGAMGPDDALRTTGRAARDRRRRPVVPGRRRAAHPIAQPTARRCRSPGSLAPRRGRRSDRGGLGPDDDRRYPDPIDRVRQLRRRVRDGEWDADRRRPARSPIGRRRTRNRAGTGRRRAPRRRSVARSEQLRGQKTGVAPGARRTRARPDASTTATPAERRALAMSGSSPGSVNLSSLQGLVTRVGQSVSTVDCHLPARVGLASRSDGSTIESEG